MALTKLKKECVNRAGGAVTKPEEGARQEEFGGIYLSR